jgi:hypothetical protein
MITVYCALYQEAQNFICDFELKKESENRHFQVFSNEGLGVRLVLTGVGGVAAATAVAELSTLYPPKKTDLLLNFGSCAGGEGFSVGDIFLCNKITECATGRTFYPDVILRHPFAECELFSTAKVVSREEMSGYGGLCDMEAAAIYQAGNYYYSPDRMLFLKVVTDHGVKAKEPVYVQGFAGLIDPFIRQLISEEEVLLKSEDEKHKLIAQAKEDAKKLASEMRCSVTMTAELTQLLFYCKLTGKNYAELTDEYRGRGQLPAKDKREGKRLLEDFREKLL